ncbi:hypothetical protein KZZ52_23705 [Dactylosporangium sp. AC04546]|uniref:hypothetical protein n=1 Tax=Dactylosporangium sp. AC04546 TaxID=2862460 RepID=UPI001EE04639|nr:hypothetical protein [Dactylosporangium sp. AC04546]WVK88283.1 hypothetical protein KZZ52_23705 [Dactylosporangium sp. AC04546]
MTSATAVVPGLPAGVLGQLARCERVHLWPGAVAAAFAGWKQAVHQPAAQLHRDAVGAGCLCCDPLEHRDVLERALVALGPRARRALLAQVTPLDDHFIRRTVHDPLTAPDLAWWRRRA